MKIHFKYINTKTSLNTDIDMLRWFLIDTPYDWYNVDGLPGRALAIIISDRVAYFSPPSSTGHDNVSALYKKGFKFVRYLEEHEQVVLNNS